MNNNDKANDGDGMGNIFFRASAVNLKKIPGSPIVYWISDSFRKAFTMPPLGSQFQTRLGLSTANNDLFLKCWHEVSLLKIGFHSISRINAQSDGRKWFPYEKGGPFRKWYGNHDFVVNWENDGEAVRNFGAAEGRIRSHNYNLDFIFKPGITWSDVTSGANAFRSMPNGFLFDGRGSSGFVSDRKFFGETFAFLNSKVASHAISMVNPTIVVNVGEIARLPYPEVEQEARSRLDASVGKLIDIHKDDWDAYEISWDFLFNPLLQTGFQQLLLQDAYHQLCSQWKVTVLDVKSIEEASNCIFIDAYGLQDELEPGVALSEITLDCNPHYRYGGDKTEPELEALLLADTMREFLSYAVGCMLGRYSLDKPGLVLANQGDTLADYLCQVPQPTFTPDADNVIPLLDGEWFNDDITERFRSFLRVTFGEAHYDENLQFIEDALGKDLRRFFLRDFYNDHVKRYKKRPIYWLFSSPKGSFNALIYLHRYRPDTVSVVLQYLRDFQEKLAGERKRQEQISISASASQSEKTRALKSIDDLKKTLTELDDYERDVLHPLATQQIAIDLDDGVKVNYPKFGAALKRIVGLEAREEE
ncbi:BREX-1 system adenine-specific DNA-methyltransferase PglX [Luteimonas sp. A501]